MDDAICLSLGLEKVEADYNLLMRTSHTPTKGDSGFCIAHSYCAHERARVQNIRDFPKTKLVSEIKSSFSLKRAR